MLERHGLYLLIRAYLMHIIENYRRLQYYHNISSEIENEGNTYFKEYFYTYNFFAIENEGSTYFKEYFQHI